MRKEFYLLFFIMIVSCSKYSNSSSQIKVPDSDEVVPVVVVKNSQDVTIKQKMDIKKSAPFFEKLPQNVKAKLINEGIDEIKFSDTLKKAYEGDANSILMTLTVYKNLKLKNEYDKIFNLGFKYNVKPILEIKIADFLNSKQPDKAYPILNKLNDKNSKLWNEYYIQKGIEKFKSKEYLKAAKLFENAFYLGTKSLSYQIAYSYLQINDIDKAIKWFKEAKKDGNKEANYELATLYFNKSDYKNAVTCFIDEYNNGNTRYAFDIGLMYKKLGNEKESIKWLKIASDNGNDEAKLILRGMQHKNLYKVDLGE